MYPARALQMKPVAAGGGGGSSTLFLCRFGASPPVDEITSNTGTLVGNATVNIANNYLTTDGTGDWVTFPASADYNLNTTDFTLEVHASIASGQFGGIVCHRTGTTAGSWALFCNGDGTIDVYFDAINGGSPVGNFAGGAANGTMRQYVVVRQGNTWKTFLAGVQKTSQSISGSVGAGTGDLYVGTDPFNATARDIAANIGRVKISNTALWTSGFTPPAITDA